MRKPVLPYANNKGADQPVHPRLSLSEASSSGSVRRISGDNEFYSIYPNGKGYGHVFHVWFVCYTPPATLYAGVMCDPTFYTSHYIKVW